MNDREKAYEIAKMQATKVRFPGVAMDRNPSKKKKKKVQLTSGDDGYATV